MRTDSFLTTTALAASAVAFSIAPGAGQAPEPALPRIDKEIVVSATLPDVWKAFTTEEGVTGWAAPGALIDLRVGGAYELYFNPTAPPGSRGMEGTKVLSFAPMAMLSYSGLPPCQAARAQEEPSWVVYQFSEVEPGLVSIKFSAFGWGSGSECESIRASYEQSLDMVFGLLERRFTVGRIDWERFR